MRVRIDINQQKWCLCTHKYTKRLAIQIVRISKKMNDQLSVMWLRNNLFCSIYFNDILKMIYYYPVKVGIIYNWTISAKHVRTICIVDDFSMEKHIYISSVCFILFSFCLCLSLSAAFNIFWTNWIFHMAWPLKTCDGITSNFQLSSFWSGSSSKA